MNIKMKKLSSLEKVFLNNEPDAISGKIDAIFRNETHSYQIAYCHECSEGCHFEFAAIENSGSFPGKVRIREVGNVPSLLPAYASFDEDYLTTKPGLFPDPLFEIDNNEIKLVPNQWRSIWIDLESQEDTPAGIYTVMIKLISKDGNELGAIEETIEVLNAQLPKQDLICTEWMHYDCIGTHYRVDMLSEEHWKLIEQYVSAAVDHGVNMLLTPLFTPPLDTKVGGERPTVQLVDVCLMNGEYSFDFTKLKRFIDMCQRLGIEYFEMSHLFTQWGAQHAPKIVAIVDGVQKQVFGWDTQATGAEYKAFLDCFLPELTKTLKEWNIAEKCWFHISDEPNIKQLDSYKAAQGIIDKHLEGFKIMDALSDLDFYKSGLVKNPVPASNHIQPFIDEKVQDLWVYYCCGQYLDVSNRFMAMPSHRNRILAVQLYKYDIIGFLHWGFNFWYTQYSIKPINPYAVTDAGCAFPSGDAFLVYPGEDGRPVESIRLKVFREVFFDLRAMKLLEKLTSKDFVMGIIEEQSQVNITFTDYPRDKQYISRMRNKINAEIKERL